MQDLVEITSVSLAALDRERLAGCHLDRPQLEGGEQLGADSPTYSFELEGWVVASEGRVAAVELLHDGKLLWQLPVEIPRPDVAAAHPGLADAELSGFYGPLSTLTMPAVFELELRALLADGSHAAIGVIEGHRAPLRSRFAPRVQPLMITTLGRTGSTVVIQLLSYHPRIASYRPYQYETKVASYWVEILRSLSEPSSYLRQLSHARNINDRRWWLGAIGEDQAVERQTRRTVPRPLPDPDIQQWMGVESIEALTEFCQSRIDGLYREIAHHFGKLEVAYFVEKYQPRPAIPSLMWEIYPDAREIILVRDFRDMVSSMFAFNRKRGFEAFGRDSRSSDTEYIEQNARSNALSLVRAWHQRCDRAHLLRYEDLILEPRETARGLLEYLGLDSGTDGAETMLAALTERSDKTEWHRTTADSRRSIGRWRTDLNEELQRVCETALGPALEEFGYSDRAYASA
jgi:hypothetical protein